MSRGVDLDVLESIVESSVSANVARAFGSTGMARLRELTRALRALYREIDPATLGGPFTLCIPLQLAATGGCLTLKDVLQRIEAGERAFSLYSRSRYDIIAAPRTIKQLRLLSSGSIVYEIRADREVLWIDTKAINLINPVPQCTSVFAIPRFRTLEEALEAYDADSIRYSACHIFASAWCDAHRIVFENRPEIYMRRSLERYLRIVLPDADTRPEGIIDETHPVDIRVVWRESNSVALIEIKWMGAAYNENRTALTRYGDARARSGANQLVGYLDANHARGTAQQTRGYLVVVDGRRGGTTITTGTPNCVTPLKYRDADVVYNPDYALGRRDFAPPRRMFAEPC